MWSPFRKKHLTKLIEKALVTKNSLDFCTHQYFKANRSLGSKDRVHIKNGLYTIIKWRALLNFHKAETASQLCELYTGEKNPIGKIHPNIPKNCQVSFPNWLYTKICESLGEKKGFEFCQISNEQAPTTIRVNNNKISTEAFYSQNKDSLGLKKLLHAKNGFEVGKKIQYHNLQCYQNGEFEPQDEASQVIAAYVNAKPNQHILDYCSGSGGKSLAFAPLMKNTGQIHLHDVRKKILIEAKKRLKRAGIQNFQLYFNKESRIKRLKNAMDTVLVDAPCSCSGTFRRRPDHKWLVTPESLNKVSLLQEQILNEAIVYLKPGGKLIYATCSVLHEENEAKEAFLKKRADLRFIDAKHLPLKSGQNDSMYLCIFEKINLD